MLEEFVSWIGSSDLAITIQQSDWLFPTFEVFHVLAISIVVGVIAIMDLRLLGIASRNSRVTQIAHDTLPLVWVAFVIAVVSGVLMFISNAPVYFINTAFRFKMLLIVLAGINMLYFEFVTARSVKAWDEGVATVPPAGKMAAALSLLFWVGVVGFGRWVGFTLDFFSGSGLDQYLTAAP